MGKATHKLINEAELFSQLVLGDERAFEQIYWHFTKRLAPYVMKMVHDELQTEEIIQDVFVQLWENRAKLTAVEYPTSYLFNIASNRTFNYLKKVASDARLMDKIALRTTELSNETEEGYNLKESEAIIEEAIAGLPEQRRLIFELSRKQGLTNEEIAVQLNLSRQTVKNQLVHSLKHIRAFMEKRSGLFSFAVYFLLTRK